MAQFYHKTKTPLSECFGLCGIGSAGVTFPTSRNDNDYLVDVPNPFIGEARTPMMRYLSFKACGPFANNYYSNRRTMVL